MNYHEFMEQLGQRAKELRIPFYGSLELTAHCNLNCKFCYVSTKEAKQTQDLSTEQWKTLIRAASDAGMIRADLTGGDPLTRDDFEELYCFAYDLGVRILLLTNGLMVDDRLVSILKKRPPDGISMTIYGATNATYHNITGDSNGFSKAVNAIDLMTRNNLPLSLKAIATKAISLDEYRLIRRLADDRGLSIYLVRYISPARNGARINSDSWRMNPKDIPEAIRIVDSDSFAKNILVPVNRTGQLDCNCGKGRFAICYDGKLTGCLSYTEVHADALHDGFETALSQLRQKLSNIKDFCQSCSSCLEKGNCSLCPGLNYAESGSLSVCTEYRRELAHYGVL